jgi:hypothetical protein
VNLHPSYARTTDCTPLNITPRLRNSDRLTLVAIATLLLLIYCGRTELSREEQHEREIEAMIACQDELGRMLGLPVVALADWELGMVEHQGGDQYRVRNYLDVGCECASAACEL